VIFSPRYFQDSVGIEEPKPADLEAFGEQLPGKSKYGIFLCSSPIANFLE